jgi:hypothetical protein
MVDNGLLHDMNLCLQMHKEQFFRVKAGVGQIIVCQKATKEGKGCVV